MKVVDEISLSIFCVIPGPVLILSLENEIQISFGHLPVFLVGEIVRRSSSAEKPDRHLHLRRHRLFGIGCVGARGRARRGLEILIVLKSVLALSSSLSSTIRPPCQFPKLV